MLYITNKRSHFQQSKNQSKIKKNNLYKVLLNYSADVDELSNFFVVAVLLSLLLAKEDSDDDDDNNDNDDDKDEDGQDQPVPPFCSLLED